MPKLHRSLAFAVSGFALLFATSSPVAASSGGTGEADPPPLVTDRPDFTESSSAVPARHLQFEVGSQFDSGEEPTEFSPVKALARYGVVDHFELRLGGTPLVAEVGDEGDDIRSLADATLGAKVATGLTDRLRVGVIPWATVAGPTREADFSSGAIATVSLETGTPVSLAANAGAGWAFGDRPDSGLRGSGSFAVGVALPAGFGTFGEVYGLAPPAGGVDFFADGGLTYRVTSRLQLDGFLAVGLSELESVSGGLGVSFIL